MNEFGFATHVGGEEYTLFCSSSIDELFQQGKVHLPIRYLFEKKLQAGLASPDGYLIITDPQPDQPGGDDGFEIIVGHSRAVTQYVLEARIRYLEKQEKKLKSANQFATKLINQIAEGQITPQQLKKIKEENLAS